METCRSRAQQCMGAQAYEGAISWAQLACTLSSNAIGDVVLLCRAYLAAQQPRRVLSTLTRVGLQQSNAGRFLMALAHTAAQQWDDVLQTLEGLTACGLDEGLSVSVSDVYLLRGAAHERLDNRSDAVACYSQALLADPLCIEAFNRLTQRSMLSPDEEAKLLKSLRWNLVPASQAALIQGYYATKSSKYKALQTTPAIDAALSTIQDNREIRLAKAEKCYVQCRFRECYAETTKLLDEEAHDVQCLPLHVACQVELRDTNNLYYLAHRLVDTDPKQAISWYAVGCYYYLTKKAEEARRYLSKSAHLDPSFGPAWIAFGHAFAVEGEHDQAMAAYSTAARLLPGSHLPFLFIGRAYASMNNFPLAQRYFEKASEICPTDPNVFHELGILHARKNSADAAVQALEQALRLMENLDAAIERHREPTLAALGRTSYMRGDLNKAELYYRQALALNTNCADTHAGLGLVYQTRMQPARAVECYHEALSIDPHDTFSSQMLEIAVMEDLQQQSS